MWENIRWRVLNSDQIEVTPDERELAWKELIIQMISTMPKDPNFRTLVNKADFKNFDYHTPLVYDVKEKELQIFNDRVKGGLNRPSALSRFQPTNTSAWSVFVSFMSAILLIVLIIVFNRTRFNEYESRAR